MVTPMLPELRDGLHTTPAVAAWSLTAYLIPFAAISDLVPRERMGRALGHYGSLQAAGQAFAPLIGGTAAAFNYRWAFAASAATALALAPVPPPDTSRHGSATAVGPVPGQGTGGGKGSEPRWRTLLNRRPAVAGTVAFGLYLSTSGVMLLVALLAGDRFGLGPDARGLVVASFGVAGLLAGSVLGRLVDRFGVGRFGIAAVAVLVAAVVLGGYSGNVAALVALTAVSGVSSTGGRLVVNTLAVTSTPSNRGGATSITLAFQFLGSALAPPALLPIYRSGAEVGFWASSTGAVLGLLVLSMTRPQARLSPAGSATPTTTQATPTTTQAGPG